MKFEDELNKLRKQYDEAYRNKNKLEAEVQTLQFRVTEGEEENQRLNNRVEALRSDGDSVET